jgi:hypothetical protein
MREKWRKRRYGVAATGTLRPGRYGRVGRSAKKGSAYAQAGETPAHPNIEPTEKTRPAAVYMLGADGVKEFPKYEKLWKDIFQLR